MRFRDDEKWINCHLQPALACRPDIVYLHVGENDVLHLSAEKMTDQLWALVSYQISCSSSCHRHHSSVSITNDGFCV